MLEKYGVTANELRVVGGGSKNRLWRRIIADAFQLPLRFPAEPESAALGGALQAAAVCAGVPVAEYVAENEPPCEQEVSRPRFPLLCGMADSTSRAALVSRDLQGHVLHDKAAPMHLSLVQS